MPTCVYTSQKPSASLLAVHNGATDVQIDVADVVVPHLHGWMELIPTTIFEQTGSSQIPSASSLAVQRVASVHMVVADIVVPHVHG